MQYQSIIRILEYCGINCNVLDVARAKKVLAVEFSISPGGIISIDGFDYSRNDVFNELECDGFAQRLPTHLLIWQTPSLLDCLEKNEVDIRQIDAWDWLRNDRYKRELTHLISPYFAVSFDKIMGKLLHQSKFRNANDWLKTLHLVDNAEDEHTALSNTRVCIAEFIKLLRNSNEVTYINNLAQLNKWFSQPWFRFVNNLPDSFYSIRNDLLSAMVNFMATIQHSNGDLCRKMSQQMMEVRNIDPDLRKLIISNHAIISSISTPQASGEKSGSTPLWLGIIPVMVILVRLMIPSGNSSGSHPANSLFAETPVTFAHLLEQKRKYDVIDTSKYFGKVNQKLDVAGNIPYYMIFEKNDTLSPVTVNIVNRGANRITVYLNHAHQLCKQVIAPGTGLRIEGSTNAVDLLNSNMGISGITLSPSPVLISDSLNFTRHQANLGAIHSITVFEELQTVRKADFTMSIVSQIQSGIRLDMIIFPGANWLH